MRIFQAIVIEHESLGDIFLELVRRPLAEAHGHGATHAEAERQHHVQIVALHLSRDLSFSLDLNCSE